MKPEPWMWPVLALGAWLTSVLLLPQLAYWLGSLGHWGVAMRVLSFAPGRPSDNLRLAMLGSVGRLDEALALGAKMEGRGLNDFAHNVWVGTLITAGRYGEAVDVGDEDARSEPTRDELWPLRQVNLAEADYNLGNWDEALARLDELRRARPSFDPLAESGEHQQRAWILAHLGRPADARRSFEAASETALPRMYRAEHHYTHAAVALAAGALDEALAAVEKGFALAVRVSSRRNGLFLRARVRVARGENERALSDFETGAAAGYRSQGGDGLLAWGDLLKRLGREDGAKAAWRLAGERDPESESAAIAAGRLGGSGSTATQLSVHTA